MSASSDHRAFTTVGAVGAFVNDRLGAEPSEQAPSNMQWQTIAEAKAKDKTERVGCR